MFPSILLPVQLGESFARGCQRFLHVGTPHNKIKGLADALEPLFLNGLTNCTNEKNKVIIDEIALLHNVSSDQVKSWIYRRRAKERAKVCITGKDEETDAENLTTGGNEERVTEFKGQVELPEISKTRERLNERLELRKYQYPVDVEPVDGLPIPTPLDVSPLILERWEHYLKDCDLPDKEYVLNGLVNGFSLNSKPTRLRSVKENLASARNNPKFVAEFLKKEVFNGTMWGPYSQAPYDNFHISRIGLTRKDDNSKWRLITDLSYPPGACVNDGIAEEDYKVKFVGIKAAIEKIRRLGTSCLLCKFDIANAYRLLPIPPHERFQLVYCWNDQYFVDLALPLGARSSSRIFTRFSDVLEWILITHGPVAEIQHMLDDYLICGPAGTSDAEDALRRSFELCEELGVPIQHKKTVHPTTKMIFLGLEFDTEAMEVRVREEMLEKIQRTLLKALHGKDKRITRKELHSLVGVLYFCSQCIPHGGGDTLERLLAAVHSVTRKHQKIKLTSEDLDDLEWWMDRLDGWNGRCLISDMDDTGDYFDFFN